MKLRAVLIPATMVLGVMLLSGVVLAKTCGATCYGDSGDNTLTGTKGSNTIHAKGGGDDVKGLQGEDYLYGGRGGDAMAGGAGFDVVEGGEGNDWMSGNRGNDRISGMDDSTFSSTARKKSRKVEVLIGESGNDTFRAKDGKKDIIRGGPGRDTAYFDKVDKVKGVEVKHCSDCTKPPGNKAPVAKNDCYDADNDDNLNVPNENATGLLSNDTDPDSGDTLKAVLVSGPSHDLSFTLNENGSFEYQATSADATPTPDSFTYKATDGAAKSNVATVNISFEGHAAIPTGGARAQC